MQSSRENKKLGKITDLFKKIGDIKETFHIKLGKIKFRNVKDLQKVEEIKKRWQEYTEELYRKGCNDTDSHDIVVIHLEPDILECEVKWALRSIIVNKLVEVIEFQLSYLKS